MSTRQEETIVEPPMRVSPFIPMSVGELLSAMLGGAIVGFIVWGAMFLLNQFVFSALLCRSSGSECSSAPTYAMIVAMVVGALVGLGWLARMRIYRPLLAVLGVTIALWTAPLFSVGLPVHVALLVLSAFFAVGYGLFAWLARPRSFLLSLLLTVLAIIAVRMAFII